MPSTPSLGPVLFYSELDPYSVDVDNRPLLQLDSNIQSIAAAMVGAGYGEHVSITGGYLTPGKAVRLLANGQIRYPDANDTNDTTAIWGMVIGNTASGLNKVIWRSSFLDLTTLGMASLVSGSAVGSYIVVNLVSTGPRNISISTTAPDAYLILGKILSVNGIISIGSDAAASQTAAAVAAPANYHNLYGFTRARNFNMMASIGSTPIQFNKTTSYQYQYGTSPALINPLRAQLLSTGDIAAAPTTIPSYDTTSLNWKLKETYSRLQVNGSDTIAGSVWPAAAYAKKLQNTNGLGEVDSFELQQIAGGIDFSADLNIDLYKQFKISRYFQYSQSTVGTPTYGKVTSIATVFDPEGVSRGGETGVIIVWDFFEYDVTTGLELNQKRAVVAGIAAQMLYQNSTIFPTGLVSL